MPNEIKSFAFHKWRAPESPFCRHCFVVTLLDGGDDALCVCCSDATAAHKPHILGEWELCSPIADYRVVIITWAACANVALQFGFATANYRHRTTQTHT